MTTTVQHILRFYGGLKAAAAFLDSLKSLAQDTKIILVLVGAYPILDALNLSPHLLGREDPIHFPRYSINKEDIVVFGSELAEGKELKRISKILGAFREITRIKTRCVIVSKHIPKAESGGKGLGLSMGPAAGLGPAACQHAAFSDQDAADRRVGRDLPTAAARQRQGRLHVAAVGGISRLLRRRASQ